MSVTPPTEPRPSTPSAGDEMPPTEVVDPPATEVLEEEPPVLPEEGDPPRPTAAGEVLWFDGRTLNHVVKVAMPAVTPSSLRGGLCEIVRSWRAVSGAIGATCSTADQMRPSFGPLPESYDRYSVDPKDIQRPTTADLILGNVGRGKFPGGLNSWGSVRTPIAIRGGRVIFADGTVRDRFFIHGGAVPGSQGCIDLHRYNDEFHAWFGAYGKELRLFVRYLSVVRRRPFCHKDPANCDNLPGSPCDLFDNPRNAACSMHIDDDILSTARIELLRREICPRI